MGTRLRYAQRLFVQVGRVEPDHAGERLPVGKARIFRHQTIAVPGGNLNEIAEHGVMLDLERIDRGRLAVAGLQRRDCLAAVRTGAAQFVERGVKAGGDIAAVSHFGGGSLDQRAGQQVDQLAMTIERGKEIFQQLRQAQRQSEPLAQNPRAGEAIANLAEIAGAAPSCRYPAERPADIGQRLQLSADIVADRRTIMEPLHQSEPTVDRLFGKQGGGQIAGQQASAGGGHGTINGMEQAALPSASQRSVDLQACPGRPVDREKFPGLAPARRMEIGSVALGHMIDIGDQPAGAGQLGTRKFAHAIERRHPEMLAQTPVGLRTVEMFLRPAGCLGKPRQQRRRTNDFRGREPGQFRIERIIGNGRHFEIAGRDIGRCQPDLALHFGQSNQHIVAARVEQIVFGQRAGGHVADDVAGHQRLVAAPRLRLGRGFNLFGNSDLETGPDQFRQIAFGRMNRHTAHRDHIAAILAARGQRNVQRCGRQLGILVEQFKKVAHPVEKQTVARPFFQTKILFHHRCHLVGCR